MRLKFIEDHALRDEQVEILFPFTEGEHSAEDILKALITAEPVAIFHSEDNKIVEVGHPYDL